LNGQLISELQTDPLPDILNFLYVFIYISEDYATTPAIFLNLANIHSRKGDFEQAISYFNKAIAIVPDYADAYHGRGITYANKGDLDQAISDLGKAIELFPDFAEAYHDRAGAYGSKGDIDNAIADLNQAIIIDPDYTESYLVRGTMYSNKGDLDGAIADYNKAIALDPYFSDAYKSRAEAYYSKQEYDKSWKDIHTLESFGDNVSPDLLDKLKKVSESRNFTAVLIIVPILVLLIFRFF
jgi:tetratricopeptide (TPR) repeat protein